MPVVSLWLFGVALPLLAEVVEWNTHTCALFFNPLPSYGHLVYWTLVPVCNALALALGGSRLLPAKAMSWCYGIAVGISAVYAILFFPLLPASLLGVMFAGIGLLGFTPLLALLVSVVLARRLDTDKAPLGLMPGFVVAFGLLLLLEFPSTATQVGLHLSASTQSGDQAFGNALLRQFGDREAMLRACYQPQGPTTGLLSSVLPGSPDAATAQQTFARITGTGFGTFPRPVDLPDYRMNSND